MINILCNSILGRTDYVIALVLAKDILSNWGPVPRQPPSAQDEVDASRICKLLNCTNVKVPQWVKYPRRFLFVLTFVTINILHAIHIAIKKVAYVDNIKNLENK